MWWYMAGAIDYEPDKGASWREQLKKMCRGPNDIAFFDPVTPYCFNNITEEVSKYIHDMNMIALEKADGIVARMMEGQSSIGTPIELYAAKMSGKKLIFITNMKKSVYIKYLSKDAKTATNIEEAYGHILNLENPVPESLRNLKVSK